MDDSPILQRITDFSPGKVPESDDQTREFSREFQSHQGAYWMFKQHKWEV